MILHSARCAAKNYATTGVLKHLTGKQSVLIGLA
jgi:hypothetical protein